MAIADLLPLLKYRLQGYNRHLLAVERRVDGSRCCTRHRVAASDHWNTGFPALSFIFVRHCVRISLTTESGSVM